MTAQQAGRRTSPGDLQLSAHLDQSGNLSTRACLSVLFFYSQAPQAVA